MMPKNLKTHQVVILCVLFGLGAGYILGAEIDEKRDMAATAIVLFFVAAIAAVLARRSGWDRPPEE